MQEKQPKLQYQLRDGRQLTYACFGDPNGTPVIFSHGLSDSRLLRHHDDDLTNRLGVRIISVDQPGVGGSSPMPNLKRDRTLFNYAKDIEELANHLQLDTFAVAGHSGGAPHALAVARYLGSERVTRGILAGPAPPLDGSAPGATEEFPWLVRVIVGMSRWFPWWVHWVCHLCTWWAKRDMGQYIDAVAKSDRTDGNPETFLCHPNQTQNFRDSFQAGFEQGSIGIRGMMQVAAINESWGFDIKDVIQPFDIFAGDLDSVITPPICQKLVNVLPNGTFHLWSNAGHYSFVDRKCWIAFWSVLRDVPGKKNTSST